MAIKYEYKLLGDTSIAGIEKQLNDFGGQGWRVVTMGIHGQILRVILERPAAAEKGV